jgi:signal transduction histidine kinase/ligand-binding sensor domain-containing protein
MASIYEGYLYNLKYLLKFQRRWKIPAISVLSFFVIAFGCTLHASHAQYSFRHLGTAEGLIQGSNYYFLEDKQGFIWISSQGGLNRFDGHVVKRYVHDELDKTTISKGEIRGLSESPKGDIWMGTEVGLSQYQKKSNRFKNYFLKDKRGQSIPSQHQVISADDSTVIYLNDQEGLVRMNYQSRKKAVLFREADFSYHSRTDIAHYDPGSQIIWLVLSSGLMKYDCKTGIKKFFFTGRKDDRFKEKLYVFALRAVNKDCLWISTDKGLVKFAVSNYEVHHVGIDMATDLVFSLAVGRDNHIWLATSNSGLIRYDPAKKQVVDRIVNDPFRSNTLTGNHLSKVHIDRKGIVWVNADPVGVDLIFPKAFSVQKFDDDPRTVDDFNKASIRGISQDQEGNLWVGTSGEGIRKITKGDLINRPGSEQGIPRAEIRGILCDSEENLWICTGRCLIVKKRGERTFKRIVFDGPDLTKCNYVKGILEVGKGIYLVTTMGGIFSYAAGRSKLLTKSSDQFSGAMHYDKKSRQLFVGRSDKDLRCYEFRNDTLLPLYDRLPQHNILSIVPDKKVPRVLWIGTDNGLVKFEIGARQPVRIFSIRDGLPDRVIYCTVTDNTGAIWLSTNNGLARMTVDGNFSILRHTAKVEFNSFASFKAADGSLYFGSAEGLFRIVPQNFSQPSSRGLIVADIWMTDSLDKGFSKAFDKSPLMLRHWENDISIELSALDYLSSIEPMFEYRLTDKGENTKWISNGSSPLIRFQNLPPDEYNFEFRAIDSNGFYTNRQMIRAIISPPFWKTWWFIVMISLLSATLVYWGVKIYVKRQQRAHQELSSRIILAQESERLRIAMDIHDDVNNTLAAAKGYLQNMEIAPLKNVERSRELIFKATEDLRNITHDLMPVQFEKNNLPDVLEKRIQEWGEEPEIKFAYIFAGEYRKLRAESELMIYRIVTEIINNIKKHSKATNSVIQLIYQDRFVVVSIEDNGMGLESTKSDNKTMGIGLKNIYSRSEYLRANLEISSDKNGVLIHLIVPYDSNLDNKNFTG